jgi:hypothetical protein
MFGNPFTWTPEQWAVYIVLVVILALLAAGITVIIRAAEARRRQREFEYGQYRESVEAGIRARSWKAGNRG